jgi:hypothetical protein
VLFNFFTTLVVAALVYTNQGGGVARHPLRDGKGTSHNDLFPGGWGGQWSEELEQVQQAAASFDLKADTQ